jgi:hypothetical protein
MWVVMLAISRLGNGLGSNIFQIVVLSWIFGFSLDEWKWIEFATV